MWRGLIILIDHDCGHAYLERSEPCANARPMREEPCRTMRRANGLRDYVLATADDLWHRPTQLKISVECPRQESNPWGSAGLRVTCVTIRQSCNRGCTIA
jgi:hypothetical protein